MKKLLYIALFFSIFISCEKENPITLPPKGNGSVMQVEMGADYKYQYFISLQNEKIIHTSEINKWDLAFQCNNNDFGVFLNGGENMSVFETNKTDFSQINYADTILAENSWKYDVASGQIDSSAIGNWQQKNNHIFLVRLDNTSNSFRKFRIKYADAFLYIIEVAPINAVAPTEVTIYKDNTKNFAYFSFDFLAQVQNIEPNKTDWDLQFTTYSFTFYEQNPPLHYVVNGVLLNPYKTFAYKDSTLQYNDINLSQTQSFTLSNTRDVIGYDWKMYDFVNGTGYSINKKYNYIIKNQNDLIFKLRFLDFYSSTGIKGSPKFEFNYLQ